MTPSQAQALRDLIVEYRDAEIAESFKGAGDPADWDQIVKDRDTAKKNLETLIHNLTDPPSITETS